ncbi:hypothetical protein H7J07_05785 [Mycobacterium koreense]|uniref:Uncharacterized protein n=1 Tax=Mycolicibacillus koreensis TaxID=1069220 RepID=A0A7I7SCA4_9MYCO|nr:hypothetical protein [Mycolicibacillus koreensis]MCV7247736.1 hypothetical protein [Mycolicibacillus koreensis]OSC34739.1 hypothetical protein B8W67_05680 [Mycolicibacillus koreensis]BBY54120.1 hypothetical protein MKOR_13710 [Mycolicibacillus koreensis]
MTSDLTQKTFAAQFEQMNAEIRSRGALRTAVDGDGEEFSWIDPEIMGGDFVEMYGKMTSLGIARGWL